MAGHLIGFTSMNTPLPKPQCPRCGARFDAPTNYCGRCGAGITASASDNSITGLGDASASELADRRNAPDPWVGRLVDNRYRVIEAIGRGGMGVVYKIEHQRMGKLAAMKVLHGDLARDSEVIRRFRLEASAVSRLTHPNTVQVFDFGSAEGALYLVMELVRGLDLGQMVKRDGPMGFERAAPLFGQICASLIEAHALGIVHRDLKPENVLVTRTHGGRDFVKVLDFGLAKLSEREDRANETDRGSIVGTPYYMSPEQIRGEDVDARSDVYSVGALMYRVLAGENAYEAKSPVGVLTKHLTAELVPPSEKNPDAMIPRTVDALVAQAMEKDAGDRFQSAAELLAALEQAFGEIASDATPIRLSSGGFSGSSGRVARPKRPHTEDPIDDGIGSSLRLRRDDIDTYERSLKRTRVLSSVAIPIALLAVAGAATYFVWFRPTPPASHEREPNNELASATLIAIDHPVSGYLGKRLGKTEPDLDFFSVPLPAGDYVVTAQVSALPNIDISIEVFDPIGRMITRVDENGVGGSEMLRRRRIDGSVVFLVTETTFGGPRLPVENVSDPYELVVTIDSDGLLAEIEPNDADVEAMTASPAKTMTGWLDRRMDIDVYRFDGLAGRYVISVGGAATVPVVIDTASETSATRTLTATLSPGDTITLRRSDATLPAGQALPGMDEPYLLRITPP